MSTILPGEFADLEPFVGWSLPTENERYAKRLSSSMDELQAFYDAAFSAWRTVPRTWTSSSSTRSRRTPSVCCGCSARS